ncbi:MAG: M48 family metalloprotease [Candidatus Heimdallarchaeota archaeon]|nr:M48 family metalloprotease [Candidatus Heimdallarchaeota archaeon]
MVPSISQISEFIQANTTISLGYLLILIGLVFSLSELKVYLKHKSTSEQLIFWMMALLAGIITVLFNDLVLGLLTGVSLIMVVETIRILDTPIWGKLMATTTITYFVILIGRAGQVWYNWYYQPATPNEQIFSSAFALAMPIFLLVSFIFFGRKFILVSKFSSPNIVYLLLFGLVYSAIVGLQEHVFPVDSKGFIQAYNYLQIEGSWRHRVMFADFGTFEALTIVMIFMYLISGWLLSVLMGVKPVTDPVFLEKVQKVAKTMGIKEEIKVGFVSAPILNAFAYGPFFDKRIAFIASDMDQFTDSDIRGIAGHELAHASRHHIVILTLLNIIELQVKKALLLPATQLDYAFLADQASASPLDFVGYYLFSYFLFAIMLIVVRILEGDADKITKEAGYQDDLVQALFRLEGFYNGFASDFGMSANLLTDRQYSLQERRRFTALAAKNLYNDVLSPSRGSAFANIFQSHPKTAYRIVGLVEPANNPRRNAFLPYRLLGFFLRKKAIKEVQTAIKRYSEAIDRSYIEDYGETALDEVLKFNPYEEIYTEFIDKHVLTFNTLNQEIKIGLFSGLRRMESVTSPIRVLVDETEVDPMVSSIHEYNLGDKYVMKDGRIGELLGHDLNDKKELEFSLKFEKGEEKISFKLFGKPLKYFEHLIGKEVIYFNKGVSRLKTVKSMEFGSTWSDSIIELNDETVRGSDIIVSFSPLGFETRKERISEQLDLLKSLQNSKITIYTKDNFDVSLAGTLEEVFDDKLILLDADGKQEIELDRLQYVVANKDTVEIVTKDHISLFTKVGIWWSNRKEFNYIVSK